MQTLDEIDANKFIELVKEYEAGDPIDFGMVRIREDDLFNLVCSHVFETVQVTKPEEREMSLSIALAKALTENTVLQLERTQNVPKIEFKR